MRALFTLASTAVLTLAAAPAWATNLTVVNQTGHQICLAADRAQHNDSLNLDYRSSAGWACVANGGTAPVLTFTKHAYVVAISDNATSYTRDHALGFASSFNYVGPSVNQNFELQYYNDADGAYHWSFEFGGANFSQTAIAAANGSLTADDAFWNAVKALGFVSTPSWDLDADQLGELYTLTLTP